VAPDRLAIVHRRMHEQRLAGEPFDTPAQVIGWLGAMQAQEHAEAKWSIGERTHGCTDADVEEAFARGEILRTHVLRPTWHFVTPQDIRCLLRLTAPRVHTASRYWYGQAGLDEATLARSHELIRQALEPGEPLQRKELAETLTLAGVEHAKGIRLGYIVMHAELEGLTVADVKAGLEQVGDELQEEKVENGGAVWYAAPAQAPARRAKGGYLIPMYDELGVAYKDLRMVLAEQPPREGLLERPVVIDGETVGSWKRTLAKASAVIDTTLFTSLGESQRAALEAAVERFGAFMELPVTLEVSNP